MTKCTCLSRASDAVLQSFIWPKFVTKVNSKAGLWRKSAGTWGLQGHVALGRTSDALLFKFLICKMVVATGPSSLMWLEATVESHMWIAAPADCS